MPLDAASRGLPRPEHKFKFDLDKVEFVSQIIILVLVLHTMFHTEFIKNHP